MKKITLRYISKNLSIILGIVLVWRGIWYLLDAIDKLIFGGSHILTVIGGIALGFYLLYLPNHDLREIERL